MLQVFSLKKTHDQTERAPSQESRRHGNLLYFETKCCNIYLAVNLFLIYSCYIFFLTPYVHVISRNISYNPIVKLQLDHFDKLDKLKSL